MTPPQSPTPSTTPSRPGSTSSFVRRKSAPGEPQPAGSFHGVSFRDLIGDVISQHRSVVDGVKRAQSLRIDALLSDRDELTTALVLAAAEVRIYASIVYMPPRTPTRVPAASS